MAMRVIISPFLLLFGIGGVGVSGSCNGNADTGDVAGVVAGRGRPETDWAAMTPEMLTAPVIGVPGVLLKGVADCGVAATTGKADEDCRTGTAGEDGVAYGEGCV